RARMRTGSSITTPRVCSPSPKRTSSSSISWRNATSPQISVMPLSPRYASLATARGNHFPYQRNKETLMHDSVALPAVPTLPALPPIPAPDAPPEHHARWLIEAVHVIRTIAHDGVLIVEN